jgi:hypothetical protein
MMCPETQKISSQISRKNFAKKSKKTRAFSTRISRFSTVFSLPFVGEIALRGHARVAVKWGINAAHAAR